MEQNLEANMNQIGLIGLGVMGKALAINIACNGFTLSVYNRNNEITESFVANCQTDIRKKLVNADSKNFSDSDNKLEEKFSANIEAFADLPNFVNSLAKPRKIILMIASGNPVDNVISELLPLIDKGDLIIDGGNSNYLDTANRQKTLAEQGILYMGTGISGGEEGALMGPSIMIGGSKSGYSMVKEVLDKIAADSQHGKCSAYMGDGGAGHFVKMVHNGIEYAMMQAIAETYQILRDVLKLTNDEIADVFAKYNDGLLNSYLMEISAKILHVKAENSDKHLVDLILDKAGQKGTGKWTAEAAFTVGIPTPSLDVAVVARTMTYFKEKRVAAAKILATTPFINKMQISNEALDHIYGGDSKEKLLQDLQNTLIYTNILIFSQGLWLIDAASEYYGFETDIQDVLKVWHNGCIIRAGLLDYYLEVVKKDGANSNLLGDSEVLKELATKAEAVNRVLTIAKSGGIPTLVMHTASDYYLSMTSETLPANLIQAQRDFFGAHTYQRTDIDGVFHTNWE